MARALVPEQGFVAADTLIVEDIARSRDFYSRVFGGEVVWDGEAGGPAIVQLANTWVIINVGGGPTDDKPSVTLEPPQDPDLVDSFLNLRVADIRSMYDEWRSRGAEFLTEPKEHEHEIRAYIRDPDGYLIEVGQSK
jgi:catechol 2,3-dioxygenase-like lactoylglutathione lyase family enzyme